MLPLKCNKNNNMEFKTKDLGLAAWLYRVHNYSKPKVTQISELQCEFVFDVDNVEEVETLERDIFPQSESFEMEEGKRALVRIIKGLRK